MTGEPVRGGSATRSGTSDGVGSILILLALALTFRVIIAYLLPGSGFNNDLISFRFWANNLFTEGLNGFYTRDFLHDYTPGYLYVLWAVGGLAKLLGGPAAFPGDLIKVPPILADIALAYLAWSMARELGAGRTTARLAAILVAINPITWFDSVIWGQVDSFGVVFLLLGLRELWRDRPERAAFLTVVGAIIKPQLGILVPIVAAVTIRRALWPKGGYGDEDPPAPRATTTRWELETRGPIRILTTGLVGFATAILIAMPFGLDLPGLVVQIFKTAGGYPYLSVNAWNLWGLVTQPGTIWVCDMVVPPSAAVIYDCPQAFMIGAVPAVVVGTVVALTAFVAVSVWVALRPDRRTMLVGLAVLALAFFVLPTRVHERYLFPLVAIGAILAAISWRWLVAYVASSAATLANMYWVITTLYPGNPQISDWLGIGQTLGDGTVKAVFAWTQMAVFAFALSELRGAASARLAREIEDSAAADDAADWDDDALDDEAPPTFARRLTGDQTAIDPAEPVASMAAMPAWAVRPSSGEAGLVGWLRSRLFERPLRPERTAGLEREPGGRLDRMDLWVVLVLGAVLLTGRVWRLGEPVQMHFDEVYHPRTAMEFLQDWRYDITHRIYEWTHPHLAKYAMALGIIAWGEDRTAATSDLGVPVLDAVIEPRWDAAQSASRIAGDRLWVATGDELRSYDLATRRLESTVAVPGAQAVAVDQFDHRVYVATASGEIRRVDTAALDTARWAGQPAEPDLQAAIDLGGPVADLHLTSDGASMVAVLETPAGSDSVANLVVVDTASASEVGRLAVGDVRQISDAGAMRVAVAGPRGVTFVDVATADREARVDVDGEARGVALVTGVEKDRLYVSVQRPDGARMVQIEIPAAGTTPTRGAGYDLPGGEAGWVGYDVATQMVHVLGATQRGGDPTVYVISPHKEDSVYADAALPFEPGVIVLDDNQRYPSSDRQQLLAFNASGEVASVETGQHAYAWRLPGVLAGVLMSILVYILARVLFRRREVGVFAAIVVALDGMLFAQSRIGMNDAYVGLGIIAAYTIFAALWRSPGDSRRHWLAFAIGMPAIGVCLGFALAAKWVAAYAIGGLGILVLTRSALGRVLLIAGLAVLTTVLGYMAISVPPGETGGNYLFLFLMIGLTLVAVVANVAHPIAWTLEELRLAVFGPIAAGVAVFLAGIGLGLDATRLTIGPIAVGTGEVAFGLILAGALAYTGFVLAGRAGFGPLAAPPPPDDPASLLDPPAAPPSGWLRPGAGLGIPMAWVAFCLVAIPVGLYVLSYVPWALNGDNVLWAGWPEGRTETAKTLLQLTEDMYRYHNTLTAPHAASSPWWAWVFDFKPVWFYQESYAGGTSAAIYDSGNLVAWWLGVPAMAFAAWQAFVRRSPALALVTIAFACQWIAWARIDRAAFQYHYYTSLPFLFLAVGYFLAELWRGASQRTWLMARLAGAAAVIAPTALWLFHRPLCGFVRVTDIVPESRACPTLIPDFVLTGRALAIAIVVGVGVLLLVRLLLALAADADEDADGRITLGEGLGSRLRTALLTAGGVSLAFIVASAFFDDTPLITYTGIPVEPIALVVTLALLPIAAFVATARDARRFVVGAVVAIGFWFVLWYPNLAALPLPTALSNAYQGFLPTYVYPFQFPVSTVDRNVAGPSLFDTGPAVLLLALGGVCVIVGYATWVWRITAAEQRYLGSDVPEADATA